MTKWLLAGCAALLFVGCGTARQDRTREFEDVGAAGAEIVPEYEAEEREEDAEARAEATDVEPFDEEDIYGPRD